MLFNNFQKALQDLITKSISKAQTSGLDYRRAELLRVLTLISLSFDQAIVHLSQFEITALMFSKNLQDK